MSSLPRNKILVLLPVGVLLINFMLTFKSWAARWSYMAADEDVWVSNAIKFWKAKKGSPIAHVPLFHDIIILFVGGGIFDSQTGYVLWKFLLYLVAITLLFYLLLKVSNVWVAFVLAVYFEWTFYLYDSPTYTILAMVFFLSSLALVLRNQRSTGIAVGILLLGSLVRLELFFFVVTALVLLLLLSRKSVLSMAFLRQLLLPVFLFIVLVYWHGSSVTRFPREYLARGQAAVVAYLVDFLYSQGKFSKYTDISRGNLTSEQIDTVLTEHFGKDAKGLLESSFLDLWKRNPSIMKARYADLLSGLPKALMEPLKIRIPYGNLSPPPIYALTVLILAVAPGLIVVAMRKKWKLTDSSDAVVSFGFSGSTTAGFWTGKEFTAFILCCLTGFIPWFMTYPQPYYLMMAIPLAYSGSALLMIYVIKRFRGLAERSVGHLQNKDREKSL
jgi:hypothetical protein